MGGTYSSNQRNFPNVNSLITRDFFIDQGAINPQGVSSDGINSQIHDKCKEVKSIVQKINIPDRDSEPHLFPKIPIGNQSAPVQTHSNYFRIQPMKQKGVKISDTHYFIINEPKHKRCNSERVKRDGTETYMNSNIIGTKSYEEPVLPYDLNEQISQEYIRTKPVKRGQSENQKQYAYNMHRGLVVRMLLQISSATEMECNSVLIGANWDFDVAEKRLKVDLLHRKGFVNHQRCTQLLERYKWSLPDAERQAEKEFKRMILERQQSNNSSRSRHSDETNG